MGKRCHTDLECNRAEENTNR